MSQRIDITQFFTRHQSDIRFLKAPVPANPPTSLTQNASAVVQGTTDFYAYIDVHLVDPVLPSGVNAPQYVQAYVFTYSYVSAGVTVVKSVYLPWLSGAIYRVQPVPPGASVSINAETVDFTGQKSVNSSTLSATAAPDTTAPAAPVISGSAVTSGGQINITSGLNAESDFDHYELWRGTGPDVSHITWDVAPIIKFFGTSIVDTAIAVSTTYWYKVVALDFSGNSTTSNIAGPLSLTSTAESPPSTPNMTGAAATAQPDGSITFTFHPNTDPALSGYRVWRRAHGATSWELLHTLTAQPSVPDPVSYNDALTVLGVQYDYTVTALSSTTAESGFPAAFVSATAADTQTPNPVTAVTIVGRPGGVLVQWTPSTSTDVASYSTNYRLTTTGSWQITDEIVTTNSVQFFGLISSRDALANQLQVRVIALNKVNNPSSTVIQTADFPSLATYRPADNTVPAGPASITVTKNDDGSVLLSWPASISSDRSGYQIEIWDSVTAAWSVLAPLNNDQSGTITYRVVGLEPFKFRSKQYRFRIRTIDYSGNISAINLMDNSGFESGDLSFWNLNNIAGNVSQVLNTGAFEGTFCVKVNYNGYAFQNFNVTPGLIYSLSAFAKQDPAFPAEPTAVEIDWYNGGTFISSTVSPVVAATSTYQRFVATGAAPVGSTHCFAFLVANPSNPTHTVIYDAAQFEQTAAATNYSDGKTFLVNAIDNQAPQDYSNVSGTNFLNMSVQGMLGQITLHWNNPPSSFSGAFDYIGGVFEIWRQVTSSNQSTLLVDGSPRKIVEVPANSDGAANKFDDLDPIETASVTATYFLKARDRYGNSSATFLNAGVGLSATSITMSQNQDSIVHEGTASGTTPAFSYHQISAQTYSIVSGDQLEFDVFIELNTANLYQYSLDFEYGAGHSLFRAAPGISDQNSLSPHPITDLSTRAKAIWYHRIFNLTSLAGQTINTWASAHEADGAAKYRGRLANIKITNGSTLKAVIYSSGSIGATTAWAIGGAGDTNYSSVNVYTSDLSVGSVNLDVQVTDGTTFLRQFGYSAEPLIGNPTFEQGGASPTSTDSGWVASIGLASNMTYETVAPLVGARSLKLAGTIGNTTQIVNRMKFTAKPGDVIFLQGLGSVSAVGVKGFLGVQFSDQNGGGSGAGTIAFTSTAASTLSLQTTAGAGTVSGFVYTKYDSTSTVNGSALFDSILASRVRSLDNEIGDGSTFFRTTANQRDGGGRGFVGLDINGDLFRDIINTRKIVGKARLLADISDLSRGVFGQNILENPSFEIVANDSQDVSGAALWTAETNTTSNILLIERETNPTQPFAGTANLYMSVRLNQSIPANTTLYIAPRYRDTIPVVPGQKYKFGGWYNTQSQGLLPAGLSIAFSFFVRVTYTDASFDDFPTAVNTTRATNTYAELFSTMTVPTPVGKRVSYMQFYGLASVTNSTGAAVNTPNFLMCDTRIDNVYLVRQASIDDEVFDGFTFGRPLLARLSSGKPWIDFSEGIHAHQHLGNMPDDIASSRFAVLSIDGNRRPFIDFSQVSGHVGKIIDNLGDGTYAKCFATRVNAGRPLINFTETIHIGKILDNIGDGTSYGRNPLGFYGGGGPSSKLAGFAVNDNPDFINNLNRYNVYDNNATGNVTLSLVADTTAPNSSGQKMRVSYAAGGESPGWGGFFLGFGPDSGLVAPFTYHRGDTLIHKIIANIPVGYSINWASNAYGNEGTFNWISSQNGTGSWATYIGQQRIGITGTFSSTGFYYLTGLTSPPAHIDVAHCEVIDIDQTQRYGVSSIDGNFRAGIDFTQNLHIGKNIDNVSDGSTYSRLRGTYLSGGNMLTSEFPGAIVNPDGSVSGTNNVKSSRTMNNLPVGSTINVLMVGQKAAASDSLAVYIGNSNFLLGTGSYYYAVWQSDSNFVLYKVISGVTTALISGSYSTTDTNIHTISFSIVTGAATNTLTASIDGQDALSIADPAIAFTSAGYISGCTGKMWDFEVTSNNLDQVPDGPTYGRPIKSRLSSGKPWIDFTENIHFGKNLDNIGDGASWFRTSLSQRDGGGRAFTAIDTGGVLITTAVDFSRSYTGKHLGNIPDNVGSSRFAAMETRADANRFGAGNLVYNGGYDCGDSRNWRNADKDHDAPGSDPDAILVDTTGFESGYIARYIGNGPQVVTSRAIPVNPNKRYYLELRIKGSNTASTFFAGFVCYDANKSAIPNPSGGTYSYSLAANVVIPGSFTVFSGVTTPGEQVFNAGAGGYPDPTQMRAGTKFITPLLLLNFNNTAGAIEFIDYFKIVEIDSTVQPHPRLSTLDDTGALDFSATHRHKDTDHISDGSGSPLAGGRRGFSGITASINLAVNVKIGGDSGIPCSGTTLTTADIFISGTGTTKVHIVASTGHEWSVASV